MRALTLIAVLLALGACAPVVVWQKAGASDEDLARDADGCRSQASAAQGQTADSGRAAIAYQSCMEKKGWSRVGISKP